MSTTKNTRTLIGEFSFSISGQYLTDISREMVISGKWREALEVLNSAIENTDISMSILTGQKKLTGNSRTDDIFLTDQEQDCPDLQKYLKTFHFQHSGLFLHKGKIYRPEYIVTSLGQEDARFAIEQNGRLERSNEFFRARAMYYAPDHSYIASGPVTMADRESDNVIESKELILWKPVDNIPLWIKPFTKIEDALDDFRNGLSKGSLRVDGASYRYNSERDESVSAEETIAISQKVAIEEDGKVSAVTDVSEMPVAEIQKRFFDDEEAAINEKEKRYAERVQEIRNRIFERAGPKGGDGWVRMPVHNGEFKGNSVAADFYVDVPRVPFLHWILKDMPAVDLEIIPEWIPESHSGMKMFNDEPLHSDWVIGAGYNPNEFYEKFDHVNQAAYAFAQKLVRNLVKFEVITLSKSSRKTFSGKARQLKPGEELKAGEVGIIPHAGVEFDAALRSAARHKTGLICLVGGRLAHIVIVGSELDVPIVMWDKADKLWSFSKVDVDTEKGTIRVY